VGRGNRKLNRTPNELCFIGGFCFGVWGGLFSGRLIKAVRLRALIFSVRGPKASVRFGVRQRIGGFRIQIEERGRLVGRCRRFGRVGGVRGWRPKFGRRFRRTGWSLG
jgi:hypothetical protein